jgi:hypothetical protein
MALDLAIMLVPLARGDARSAGPLNESAVSAMETNIL